VLSDNADTPHSDWFMGEFVVDWTGWREIALAFSHFRPLRSVRALDISEWTEPEEVAAGTSYAGVAPFVRCSAKFNV
jgi:hypothetical protein